MALLGERIRHYREMAGLSQARLAQIAGTDSGSISRIERGVVPNPGVRQIMRIATALGVGMESLVTHSQALPDVMGAISKHPSLSRDQKAALIATVRTYLGGGR